LGQCFRAIRCYTVSLMLPPFRFTSFAASSQLSGLRVYELWGNKTQL
jgi:hypothetical protein